MRTKSAAIGAGLWALAFSAAAQPARPWMDPKLDPDQRARMVEQQMTDEERYGLLHGPMALPFLGPVPPGAVGSAGYIAGVPRLGVPALQESDASLGVTNPANVRPDDGGVPLPSGQAMAATFDPELAFQAGAMIGREAHSKGLNVMLAGGANLARDPRNGRNFEYLGEDPLLAGTLAGEAIRGTQSEHVISTTKHFALNDQETLRHSLSGRIGEAAFRESDLLAFQLAIERGQPGAVMCAYNRINGAYACDNDGLLNQVLKGDWGFKGWVMSDWGAVPGVQAALHGLDQQSGQQIDPQVFFDAPLKAAVASGQVPQARVSDMARRILRSMFAAGLIEHPSGRAPVDLKADGAIAQKAAEEGIVLLKNERGVLPLAASARSIVLIGGRADVGVLSGGGSSQVIPPEGPAARIPVSGTEFPIDQVFHASSPLKALKAELPQAQIAYQDGVYASAAALAASKADVAIVFITQWMTEGQDAADLTLPYGQDQLVEAVAAANPNTIVVLETGGPVLMPWLGKVGALVQAWYPGYRGGEALAGLLSGRVNPSGRLPVSFPASEAQLPRPRLPGLGEPPTTAMDVDYDIEGSDVGYRWFARQGTKPLFPFGYGLAYTRYAYGPATVRGGRTLTVSFTVSNTGERVGTAVPQVYLTGAAGQPLRRLIGFQRVELKPGESRQVTITADPRLLARYDGAAHGWRLAPGAYQAAVGASAEELGAPAAAQVLGRLVRP